MLDTAARKAYPQKNHPKGTSHLTVHEPLNFEKSDGIIGQNPKMQQISRLVKRVAQSDSTVIINGESGSGKGLIARAIHRNSQRKDKPFITSVDSQNIMQTIILPYIK